MVLRALLAVFFAAVLVSSGGPSARAQGSLIHHVITTQKLHQNPMGRDFWYTPMSNYWGEDLGGKYIRLYITAAKNTTAFVVSEGQTAAVPIQAYKVGSFKVPEFWEIESSGIPEQKVIHIYSNDADLTCYEMSHNPYTSDGSYIIPTIGWGTDYVVAAYGSLFEGATGGYVYDLPSTMVVVADQDNTTVTITPSCDCRQCMNGSPNGNAQANVVVFPQGSPQTFTLNRGWAVELLPIWATGPDNFDLTGTIVHASVPVGVEGGSVCPNIPDEFPYCDHVEDMMPPTRTWAETYYTTSFAAPPNKPTHDYARYLFIASQPNQTIYRHDCATGDHTECQISNQYGFYWDELEQGQKFWSDAPFSLTSYINSASYPDMNNGVGDPAEVVINPREQFSDTIIFQTPQSIGNIIPYTNYCNIIVNVKDAGRVLFDNKKVTGIPSQCIDGSWEIFTITGIAPGTHTIYGSDSGVGCYIYGYGYDESYAWTGSFGTATYHSPDTIPPVADTSGHCYQSFVHLTDSGFLPGGVDKQSGLQSIAIDSVYNMSYLLDPDWLDGRGVDSGGYGMFVVDPTKPAILIVNVFDAAGNETTITSTYQPQVAEIVPPLNNLGVYNNGSPPNIGWDTLINLGTTPFNIDSLQLKYGTAGFSLHNAAGGPVDKSPLAPKDSSTGQSGRRLIQIQFVDPTNQSQVDSIIFGDFCDLQVVAVIGSGGAPDFAVTSNTWPNVLLTKPVPTCYQGSVRIENLSKSPITIDSASWPDGHFTAAPIQFPVTVPPSPANVPINITYCPDNGSLTVPNRTQGKWYSHEVLEADGKTPSPRNDSLIGWAISPSETFGSDTVIVTNCNQQGDTIPITFTIAATGTSTTTIKHVYQSDTTDFFNLTGTLPSGVTWNPDTGAQNIQPGTSATITISYIVPSGKDTSVADVLTVVDGNGDTIATTDGKTVTVTVITNYYAGQVIPPTLTFGTTPFQGAGKITKQFIIQNTAQSGLIITSVGLLTALYNPAFTITTVPPIPAGGADTLPPTQLMTVTVTYNDSLFFDPTQIAEFAFGSNSCVAMSESDTVNVTVDGATLTATPLAPVLSCNSSTSTVTIGNLKPKNKTDILGDVVDTVIGSPVWIGANSQYFSYQPLPTQTIYDTITKTPLVIDTKVVTLIPGYGSLNVPVTFNGLGNVVVPPSGVGTYTETLKVHVRSNDNTDTTMTVVLTGIAGSALVTATSDIANSANAASDSAHAHETMSMPVMAKVTIPTIPAGAPLAGTPLVTSDQLNITGMKLTYVIPDGDLLTFQSFTIGAGLNSLGWKAQPPVVTPGAGTSVTITVMLGNNAGAKPLDANTLTSNLSTFGQFNFQVDLDKAVNSTPVTLQSVLLDTGASGSFVPVSCIATAQSSDSMSLVLACGDQTLRDVMNGVAIGPVIGPATPDPVTGGNVTFKYSNRGAMSLSLAVYDELGNVVAQPVNNVYHEAGSWQVTADVSKLPSGTYTYRLSGNSVQGGPMAVSNQFVIQR